MDKYDRYNVQHLNDLFYFCIMLNWENGELHSQYLVKLYTYVALNSSIGLPKIGYVSNKSS